MGVQHFYLETMSTEVCKFVTHSKYIDNTETVTNSARYGSIFVTFYNKKLRFSMHYSSVVDSQTAAKRFFWQLGRSLVAFAVVERWSFYHAVVKKIYNRSGRCLKAASSGGWWYLLAK